MLDSLIALLLLAALTLLAYGVGATFLRRLEVVGLERTVFAVPLGLGTLAMVVFALGLLRQAKPVPLTVGIVAVGLLLGAPGWLQTLRSRGARPPAESAGPAALLAAVALGLAGLFTLAGALAPPSWLEWDALSYHLAVPKVYLREGRILFLPYDHHSNFPFLLQMLFLWMLALGSVAGAKLVHWLCGVVLVLSVLAFARRHLPGGKRTGLLAAVVLATTPIVLWEASVAYVDLATALFVWLSVYALLNAAEQPGWRVVSAVLMGFALGTKMTVLGFWGMGLAGIAGWGVLVEKRALPAGLRPAALWGALSLAIGAPWYLKTFLYTGNPVYPFFYSLFGGRYWSAQIAAQYAAEQGRFGYGKGFLALLLAPLRVSLERWLAPPPGRPFAFSEYALAGGYDLGALYLALLLLVLPFAAKKLPRPVRVLLLSGAGVFLFWFFLMQQTRYLIPALPAAALAAAAGWSVAPTPVRAVGGALVALGALFGLATASIGTAAVPGIVVQALPYLTGAATKADYIASRDGLGGLGAACLWINDNAPADAKVALFNDTQGFYLEREYLWAQPDHHHGLIPWESYASSADFVADFKRRGYTYWLDNTKWAADDGKPWRALLAEAIGAGQVEPVFDSGPVHVYRIP